MKLLLAALLSIGAAVPVQSAAADTAAPKLEAVEFSRVAITVNGLEVKLLTITAHITDETGVDEAEVANSFSRPFIGTRGGGATLTLGRGTPQDGWYTGGVAITSSWSGDYRPSSFSAIDLAGNEASVRDLSTLGIDLPTLTVTSSNRPKIEQLFTPDPVDVGDRINRTIRVTDAAGRPLAGVGVQAREDNTCAEDLSSQPDGRTNEAGEWAAPPLTGNFVYEYLLCALLPADFQVPEQRPTFHNATNSQPRYRYRVSATPAATSAPAGSNVAVTGNLVPAEQRKELQLQRLYAPGDWRTVARGQTTPASRFTLTATPPGTSLYSYRVFAPGRENRAAAYSPVFTIRGT